MATTIIKCFEVGDNDYLHEMNLSDDSISLKQFDNDDVLLHYDSHCTVRKQDGSVYGDFKIIGEVWYFKTHDDQVIFGNKTSEPDGLIDFEVEISKMYIKELDDERTI